MRSHRLCEYHIVRGLVLLDMLPKFYVFTTFIVFYYFSRVQWLVHYKAPSKAQDRMVFEVSDWQSEQFDSLPPSGSGDSRHVGELS